MFRLSSAVTVGILYGRMSEFALQLNRSVSADMLQLRRSGAAWWHEHRACWLATC